MADPPRNKPAPLWGISAEFDSPEALLTAVTELRHRSLGRLDAYAPIPLPAVTQALEPDRRPLRLTPFAVGGALLGGCVMFGVCVYATMVSYRFDIGGRPAFSWPYFLVPSLSFAMLTGALMTIGTMLFLNRLPRLNHPAFNIPGFTRTTANSYVLIVEAVDDSFDTSSVHRALQALSVRPHGIHEVAR